MGIGFMGSKRYLGIDLLPLSDWRSWGIGVFKDPEYPEEELGPQPWSFTFGPFAFTVDDIGRDDYNHLGPPRDSEVDRNALMRPASIAGIPVNPRE